MNNLDVSCDYTQRLTSELITIPSITKNDYKIVEKWFTSLNNITTDNFKPILQVGEFLNNNLIVYNLYI